MSGGGAMRNVFNGHVNGSGAYQEYCNPCETDVIKRDRALKGVPAELLAISVILVPIDTGRVCGYIRGEPDGRCCEIGTNA